MTAAWRRSSRPPFEPRASTGTSTAAIGPPASTAAATTAAIVAAAITSTTPEGALESGARISAYARGVSWEFFARFGSAAAARSASLAGKQRRIVFCGLRCSRSRCNRFVLWMLSVLGMLMLRVLGMFGTFRMLAANGSVLRFLVGNIRFSFLMSRVGFRFRDFMCGKWLLSVAGLLRLTVLRFRLDGMAGAFGMFGGVKFLGFLGVLLGLFFVFHIGVNATDLSVSLGVSLKFFVLGFHQTG